ncbi:MAG: DUF2461 domain-containing protein [Anaerolineales bacterium]
MTLKAKSTFDLNPTVHFLDELSQHNSKAWFDMNRAAYQAARVPFEGFIDFLIDEFRIADNLQGLSAKECIFRLNRDLRFSRDKTPYKTNLGAVIGPGGRKSTWQGYYVSIEPHDRSMIAGGLYMPSPEQLGRFRQAVSQHPAALKRIIGEPAFVEQYGKIEGERLKTAPKGYDQDHPEIELLRLKQITVLHPLEDQAVLAEDFAEKVIRACRAMRPFLDYLEEVLQ